MSDVPALRFPEFSNEWSKDTLQNVVAFSNGKAHENCVDENGCYILVNSKFVSTEGSVIKKATLQLSPLFKSQFVMVMSDLPNGKALAKCFYIEEDNIYTLNQRICSFTAQNGNVSRFLMYQINRNKYYLRYDDGINQTNLKKGEVLACPVFIPSIQEQTKIATFIHLLDKRIATQTKIIEKYESLIQAICDTLIEAEQHKVELSFNDFGEPYSGLSGKSSEDFGEGCQYITYMNVYQNQIIDITDVGLVKINDAEQQSVVRYGDILFTLSSETPNEVGMGAVYLGDTYPIYLNSFCFGVHIIDKSKIFPPFLAYYISIKSFRKAVFPLAQGSTRFNLQKSDFMKKKFLFPTVEKQNKIYSVLKAFSDKLSIEKNITNLLCEQKSYLLRQLFI